MGKAEVGNRQHSRVEFTREVGSGNLKIRADNRVAFNRSGIFTMFANDSEDAYMKFGQYRNASDRGPGTLLFSDYQSPCA